MMRRRHRLFVTEVNLPGRRAGLALLPAVLALLLVLAACSSANIPLPTPEPTISSSTAPVPSVSTSPVPSTTRPANTPSTTASPASNQVTDFVGAVQRVLPSVVQIEVTYGPQGAPGDPQARGAAGSGWVYRANGLIVTNNHVIEEAQTISVILPDGTKYVPTSVQADPARDLAVVRIGAGKLTALTVGDSTQLDLAQPVAAIGNALNLGIRVTVGVVSRLNVSANYNNISLTGLIETDAAINPGNSGGVLINILGEVVGIPNAGLNDPSLDVENFSYAIGINEAAPVIESLISSLP